MAEFLVLSVLLWCAPSLALVALATWHLYRARQRARDLHLDAAFGALPAARRQSR